MIRLHLANGTTVYTPPEITEENVRTAIYRGIILQASPIPPGDEIGNRPILYDLSVNPANIVTYRAEEE